MNGNRRILDELMERFNFWMHIEDPYVIYTIAAIKATHRMPGDPTWLMLVGPSSDGKSEILRAFTQEQDHSVDDITPKTFVSGYISKKTDTLPQFAEIISGNILFIYDLSIMMSKHAEERSQILSDMRMIYDGKITKRFGNKQHVSVKTEGTTFICGSTPVIDTTILEDQLLGTRFLTYRIHNKDRQAVMNKIVENMNQMGVLRNSLKTGVFMFESNLEYGDVEISDTEYQGLMTLTNQTTLLRTSPDLDKHKEPKNVLYPEGPGRLLKQFINLYKAYKLIGLTQEEALTGIRKIAMYNVIPIRSRIMEYMMKANNGFHTTSEISKNTKIGKGYTKGQMFSLYQLGICDYDIYYDERIRRDVDRWKLNDCNFNLLFDMKKINQEKLKKDEDEQPVFSRVVNPDYGKCGYCGNEMMLLFRDQFGNRCCESCRQDY